MKFSGAKPCMPMECLPQPLTSMPEKQDSIRGTLTTESDHLSWRNNQNVNVLAGSSFFKQRIFDGQPLIIHTI